LLNREVRLLSGAAMTPLNDRYGAHSRPAALAEAAGPILGR